MEQFKEKYPNSTSSSVYETFSPLYKALKLFGIIPFDMNLRVGGVGVGCFVNGGALDVFNYLECTARSPRARRSFGAHSQRSVFGFDLSALLRLNLKFVEAEELLRRWSLSFLIAFKKQAKFVSFTCRMRSEKSFECQMLHLHRNI